MTSPDTESSTFIPREAAGPEEWLATISTRLEQQQPFLAFDLAQDGARRFPNDDALPLAAALALMRSHSFAAAHAVLDDYPEAIDGALSSPAREQLAEILRLECARKPDPATLSRARHLYAELFESTRRHRHGLWAAVLCLRLGDKGGAHALANRLYERVCSAAAAAALGLFQHHLLSGHAAMILGRNAAAAAAYRLAAAAANDSYREVLRARSDFDELAAAGIQLPAQVSALFVAPQVVVFGGQVIDPPGLVEAMFPPGKEDAVRDAIIDRLAKIDARIGYSSAACGSDILFLEALVARGGEAHIVLPCALDDFIDARVAYAGTRWVERLHALLKQAATVGYATSERYLGHRALLRYANHMIAGSGWLRAQLIGRAPHLIAVWDYRAANLPGSSSDFIDHWPDATRMHLINLDELANTADCVAAPAEPAPALGGGGGGERVIRTMLFADVVGYSKLGEEFLPQWFALLRHVEEICHRHAPRPDLVEAWGDALYVVMADACAIVRYAFALRHAFTALDHTTFGLPQQLNIRIGLHAGPVYREIHPLSERVVFMGRQVNRAARIEPITIPGEVYASQELVALLTVEDNAARHEHAFSGDPYTPWFRCEYLGVIELPKAHGQQSVYHLLPAAAAGSAAPAALSGETAPRRLHLSLKNGPQEMARLASALEDFCARRRLSATEAFNLNLVFDELVTNIMEHGFGTGNESERIEIVVRADEHWLRAEIVDDGRPFNPLTQSPSPDLDSALAERPIGGLGVHLVRELMDEMEYRREGGFNRLRLARSLAADGGT